MSERRSELYIARQTKRRLHWIASIAPESATADAVGDRLLNKIIEQEYPNIVQIERELKHVEKELLAKLQNPPAGIQHL